MPGIVPQRQVAGEQACRNHEAESGRDADSRTGTISPSAECYGPNTALASNSSIDEAEASREHPRHGRKPPPA